nr:hypothetical protein WMHIBSEC_WMHIBSEC_CDS_0053 [Caudoviricetes sp.]
MEQKRLNIAEILEDYPKGTNLYSPPFGKVTLDYIDLTDKFPIVIKYNDGVNCVSFMKDGRYVNMKDVECCLFPSKGMRDWEKMKWKRGDVLYSEALGCFTIFAGWANDEYTMFDGRYIYNSAMWRDKSFYDTKLFDKANENEECCLFPSKGMRDWEKMKWKRGDVLYSEALGCFTIFAGWANDEYTMFDGRYIYNSAMWRDKSFYDTKLFDKANENDTKDYFKKMEKTYGGTLNRETLEIEKSFEPKNGDFICFVDEDSERHIVIFKSMDSRWLKYYASVMRNGTWFNCNSAFGTTFNERENIFNLRLATEKEKQVLLSVLASRGKTWDSEKCCVEELPNTKKTECPFKPFDKVLVRISDVDRWRAAFFESESKSSNFPYSVIGYNSAYIQCIPYEGNEHLLGTTKEPKTK